MPAYLFKTEPGVYSFERLQAEKTAVWDGITSNAALAHLRNVRAGDQVFIYHTGDEKAIVGLAEAASNAYGDSARPDLNSSGAPRFPVVKLRALKPAKSSVTLAQLKADPRFGEFALVRQPRLSVMPVPAALERILRTMTGL